jgi:hypothetical protein
VDVFALGAFKGPQIGVGSAKLDPRQHHAALALRAARAFDWKQRRLGMMGLRHVMMHPESGGSSRVRCGDGKTLLPLHAEGDSIMWGWRLKGKRAYLERVCPGL